MKNYVFYSWQSDLPNNNNRSFIESCIKDALRELNLAEIYNVEYSIDKDTMNETGTPHITETIFSKIDKSTFFIADISIINNSYNKRKMPNPNVLIELGYAAKTLGWTRVICIYNTDYGVYDDLPFDLKYRRPLCYSGINKAKEKKRIVEAIKDNIMSINSNEIITFSDVGTFLILETSNYMDQLEKMINKIFEDKKVQKKYNINASDYKIEITNDSRERTENSQANCDVDIQHCTSIIFTDDKLPFNSVNDFNENYGYCSIFFYFKEKIKQINFQNKKVYSAFEVILVGFTLDGKRNYKGLTEEIMLILKLSLNHF